MSDPVLGVVCSSMYSSQRRMPWWPPGDAHVATGRSLSRGPPLGPTAGGPVMRGWPLRDSDDAESEQDAVLACVTFYFLAFLIKLPGSRPPRETACQ